MDESSPVKGERSNGWERLKRYLAYALLLFTAAVLIYVFVWFGAQLGLQN